MNKVEIDRNYDTFIEFSEQYLGDHGKISSWDSDGNGVIDYQYIRYPDSEDGKLYEETIIYSSNGIEYVALRSEDSVPVSLKYEGREMEVFKGTQENFYWIEEEGAPGLEKAILEQIQDGITDGAVQIVNFDENTRLSVIKIGSAYYCKKVGMNE